MLRSLNVEFVIFLEQVAKSEKWMDGRHIETDV